MRPIEPVKSTKAQPQSSVLETPAEQAPAPTKPASATQRSGPIILDWAALIEETRQNHLALHSVLSKCTHKLEGETLTLFTGRKFNKTKLDSAKYRPQLSEILAQTGVGASAHVDIRDTTAPPKDEQAARIAAMMGGGEEVDVS